MKSRIELLFLLLLTAGMVAESKAQIHFSQCVYGTGSSATVLVDPAIFPRTDAGSLSPGDEVAVFTEQGACAGVAEWTGSVLAITAWGDDPGTGRKDGLARNEKLSFAVWDQSAGREIGVESGTVDVSFQFGAPYHSGDTFENGAIYSVSSLSANASVALDPTDFAQQLADAKARTSSGASATVNLQPGVYSLPVQIDNPGPGTLTIVGAAGTVFSGFEPAPTTYSNGRHEIIWPDTFDAECPNLQCDPSGGRSGELGLRWELVRVDGELMTPVGSCSGLSSGQVCREGDRVYVAAPQSSLVEWSRVTEGMFVSGRNIVFEDFVVEGVASHPETESAALHIRQGENITLNRVSVRQNNWNGLELQVSFDMTCRDCQLVDNGHDGLTAHLLDGMLIEGSLVSGNGWRAAAGGLRGWSVGNKVLRVLDGTIRNSDFSDNEARGLWLDYANERFLIEDSRFERNGVDGVWSEANPGPVTIRNSVFANNVKTGIHVSSTDSLYLIGNVSRDNDRQLSFLGINRTVGAVDWDHFRSTGTRRDRWTKDLDFTYWTVSGNVFDGTGTQKAVWMDHDGSNAQFTPAWNNFVATSQWSNNQYCNPTNTGVFGVMAIDWFFGMEKYAGLVNESGAVWCGNGPPDVNLPPVAAFTASVSGGEAPLSVQFDARSSSDPDGSISVYAWTFGDGASGNGDVVEHTFTNTGEYTVRLTVVDNDGFNDSTTRTVAVTSTALPPPPPPPPPPSIATGLVLRYPFEEVSGTTVVDSSGLGHNGSAVNGVALGHTGILGRSLRLDGVDGHVQAPVDVDLDNSVIAERTITAWFNADDPTRAGKKQIIFEEGGADRGLSIYVHDGKLYARGWNLPVEESGWNGSHIATDLPNDQGWHHVALVLNGGSAVAQGALSLYLDGVKAGDAEGSQIWGHKDGIGIGATNNKTTFHDESSSKSGTHAFAGMIDELCVFNSVLTSAEIQAMFSAVKPAENNQPPVAKMVVTPPAGQAPQQLNFDGSGSVDPDGSIAAYAWSFGDGKSATGPTTSHAYEAAGIYDVTLTVTDNDGSTGSVTQPVEVTDNNGNHAPVAVFTVADTGIRKTKRFDGAKSTDVDGRIEQWQWQFGDGATGVGVEVEHTYRSGGKFTVKLTVVDDRGASHTISTTVKVSGKLPDSMLAETISSPGTTAELYSDAFYEEDTWTLVSPAETQDPRTDALLFVHRPAAGNIEIVAHVTSLQNNGEGTQAGVMVRSDLTESSSQVAMVIRANGECAFLYRVDNGGWEVKSEAKTGKDAQWVKLVRVDNQFEGFVSVDGLIWESVGKQTIPMQEDSYTGLAAAGDPQDESATATFDNLSIKTGSEVLVDVPAGHMLTEPYPNPFSSKLAFTLTLARQEEVRVAMYNIVGEQVQLLHDGPMAANEPYAFALEGGQVPSGVYLVHVVGESFSSVKRVIRVR